MRVCVQFIEERRQILLLLMAVENSLPTTTTTNQPSSNGFNSSSSSTSSNQRQRLVQVATNNSATFIQFLRNSRQAVPFIPICRPRTDHSSTRYSPQTIETQSSSNQSKSFTNAPTSSVASGEGENKRGQSQQRINPILTNPLLNHRKEHPKTPPLIPLKTYSRTTRLCLSSKPFRTTNNDTHTPTIRASTAPILAHPKETNINVSDRLILSIDQKRIEQEQQTQYIDQSKYDYITRWLNEVRAATHSTKTKRTKRAFVM